MGYDPRHQSKFHVPEARTRSPFVIRAHSAQRALLLVLVAVFASYTTFEYFTTRDILSECAEITAQRAHAHVTGPDAGPPNSTLPDLGKASTDDQYFYNHAGEAIRKSAAIGKATMLYGAWAEDENNRLVLRNQQEHAEIHGHSFHLLDRQIMGGMWSKLSYMLHLVLEELAKPEEFRMQWMFWVDLDNVVMNPNVPLDIFLPPKDGFSHINVMLSNDQNGLNTGSFFLRISEWSVKYLIDIIALRTFRPELQLKYSDQSAQEVMTRDKKYSKQVMYVPQRWFNAYRGPRDEKEQLVPGVKVPDNTIKPGDLQLHFAGKKVKHLIPTYLALAANNSMGWNIPLKQTRLEIELALFWKLAREKAGWEVPIQKTPDSGKLSKGR